MNKEFVIIPQEAPCQYFGLCGGCSLQTTANHKEYKFHLFEKAMQQIPHETIHEIQQIPPRTRRRVNFKITNNKLSFNQFRSNNTIAIADCLLLEDSINQLIAPINRLLKKIPLKINAISLTNSDTGIEMMFYTAEKSNLDYEILLTEFAKDHNISRISWQNYTIIQYRPLQLKFGSIHIDLPTDSFLQVSKESSDLMSEIILSHLDNTAILELYCGVGSFTIPMSSKAQVTAYEGNGAAIDALNKATGIYSLAIKAIKQDLYQNPVSTHIINSYTQVVINPPRNGATPQIKQIAEAKRLKKVILVSCNLENLIRDSKILIKNGFSLTDAYPIDQFLYSNHLEIIAVFSCSKN